jgi:Macrocin-O-methyltransferase (TylF)
MDNQMSDQSIKQETAILLYLDLLKRCLLDSIFIDDPLANYVPYRKNPETNPWKQWAGYLQRFLSQYRLKLVQPCSLPWVKDFTALSKSQIHDYRAYGRHWPARAHTMIGRKRLDNLQECAEIVLKEEVPGDFVETGVWRVGHAYLCGPC